MVWAQVEPQVEKALAHGQGDCTTPTRVKEAIRNGNMFLWAMHEGEVVEAICVLSIYEHPPGKKLFIEVLAGRGSASWGDEFEKLLMDYADKIGAFCIEGSCRRGLARYLLRREHWTEKAVIMEITRNGKGE